MDSTEVLPTPEELVLVVKMICGVTVDFKYRCRNKRGVAKNEWTMYLRWSEKHDWTPSLCMEGPTKNISWGGMVPAALRWADGFGAGRSSTFGLAPIKREGGAV